MRARAAPMSSRVIDSEGVGIASCVAASVAQPLYCGDGHRRSTPSARALEMARTLVRMNTVSRESNLALIHFIRDELARHGVPAASPSTTSGRKANLFATVGEGKPAGVIVSGHTDTVPWDGQDWSLDPLGAEVQGRPPLRPRQRRHEGLHRPGRRAGAGLPRGRPAVRDPLRLQLRRGGRLLRRAAASSPTCASAASRRSPASSASRPAWCRRSRTRASTAGAAASRATPRIRR